jgi:hypothetical protein
LAWAQYLQGLLKEIIQFSFGRPVDFTMKHDPSIEIEIRAAARQTDVGFKRLALVVRDPFWLARNAIQNATEKFD